MPKTDLTLMDLFPREQPPQTGVPKFICTQPPAVFQEPYGGTCGQLLGHGERCTQTHGYRPVPFSQRVVDGTHIRRSA